MYLWIHDDGVEIRDAHPIKGKDSIESAQWLKGQTTDKASVAVIGPAGERLARIAGIPHVGTIVRQAARCGLGAVMGSKNLKAMVTFGTQNVIQAHKDGLREQMKTVLPPYPESDLSANTGLPVVWKITRKWVISPSRTGGPAAGPMRSRSPESRCTTPS